MEKLRHYVPDGLVTAAGEAAGRETADARRAAALGDAYWIRAALLAKESGAPAGPAAAVAAQQAADQDGEVARLERVAAAYRTVTAERAREVLTAATTSRTARQETTPRAAQQQTEQPS